MAQQSAVVDEIETIYRERGGDSHGERVTQLEHSLLAAPLVADEGVNSRLRVGNSRLVVGRSRS